MGELCNAILAGLVSITAGCDGVTDWGALLIGFIGAFWYILGKKMLYIFGVDDAFLYKQICIALYFCDNVRTKKTRQEERDTLV